MKCESINLDSIQRLMDVFYAKVRADSGQLGEIFNTQIGTSDEEWAAHKKKIASFWEGMLLNSGGYQGQPLKAHLDLPPFPRELFAHWLNLFAQSLESVFSRQEDRDDILQRAEAIAQRFQFMIYESGYMH